MLKNAIQLISFNVTWFSHTILVRFTRDNWIVFFIIFKHVKTVCPFAACQRQFCRKCAHCFALWIANQVFITAQFASDGCIASRHKFFNGCLLLFRCWFFCYSLFCIVWIKRLNIVTLCVLIFFWMLYIRFIYIYNYISIYTYILVWTHTNCDDVPSVIV